MLSISKIADAVFAGDNLYHSAARRADGQAYVFAMTKSGLKSISARAPSVDEAYILLFREYSVNGLRNAHNPVLADDQTVTVTA